MAILAQLPKVIGKTGWPWTTEVDPVIYEYKLDWPKISIVMPSFMQGRYITEAICSILLQNYPALEFIIIDGGSDDETVEVIKKYEQWINYWISEPDGGQSNAINKGLALSTGIIFNWINSDDLLQENALYHIAKAYMQDSKNAKLIAGGCTHFNESTKNKTDYYVKDVTFKGLINERSWFQQPAQWLILANTGKPDLNERLNYSFDWEMILNLNLKSSQIIYLSKLLANFRVHPASKTSLCDMKFKTEKLEIVTAYLKQTTNLVKYIMLVRYIYRLKSYLAVQDLFQSLAPGFKDVFNLGIHNPQLLFSRFYLGSLSKILKKS